MRNFFIIGAMAIVLLFGCTAPKIRLFPSQADPLREFTLQGEGENKVLVIHVRGLISTAPREQFIRTRPSMVQEIVSQLRKAQKDKHVRAILLKVDSPGGSATASDILYNEIANFKKKTNAKVIVAMVGMAASGGYYISLPADYIMAHPTTITGSIGVIFIRPKVTGLMQKIGIELEVNKSGKNKDMGSPFRPDTAEEEKLLQTQVDQLGRRFVDLVMQHRGIGQSKMAEISSGRIFLADKALQLGLIDKVGYLDDALDEAKRFAGLPENAKVVVYRRIEYPDDNLYNTTTTQYDGQRRSLISLSLPGSLTGFQAGFYYLWPAAAMAE